MKIKKIKKSLDTLQQNDDNNLAMQQEFLKTQNLKLQRSFKMNKWMEFSNEYAQLMKDNFQVMNKFWRASMDQTSGYTKKSMELFFDHMNRNVEFMHEAWNNTANTNEELRSLFRENIEKFNNRYQKVYEETIKAIQPKEKTAEK